MTNTVLSGLKGTIDMSFKLLGDFMEVCPEDIWAETSGGWPVWQQVYHIVTAVDFFLDAPDAPEAQYLAPGEITSLRVKAENTMDKDEIRAAFTRAVEKVNACVAGLTDAALAEPNKGVFARARMEMNMAGTLSMLAAHTLYHLGGCDAALRNHGIPGVF